MVVDDAVDKAERGEVATRQDIAMPSRGSS
jgi:hypothetical protein